MKELLYGAGRALGTVCGAALAAGWTAAMWFPEAGLPLEGAILLVVAFLMVVLAIVAVLASLHGHGVVLIIVFFASFTPVGFSLLDLDNWFQLIGWLNLGLLAAGIMTWAGAPRRAQTDPGKE